MRYQQRGMTLTELVVYMALAVLATVLLWALQKVTMTARNATTSNYLVNGQTETCVDWIRQDINETALTSVLVYPQQEQNSLALSIFDYQQYLLF